MEMRVKSMVESTGRGSGTVVVVDDMETLYFEYVAGETGVQIDRSRVSDVGQETGVLRNRSMKSG